MRMYLRFAAMIGTSTLLMYGLMYLNTLSVEHVYFNETRAYMALIMGATMTVVMLAFMLHMLGNAVVNVLIILAAAALFVLAVWLVRSQATVDDVSWMRAMIPHHSIAILTSERARLEDPRVRQLAERIVESQRREIDEMKSLLRQLRAQEATTARRTP